MLLAKYNELVKIVAYIQGAPMRVKIQQLVDELSQFNVPADFKVLKAIFAKHPISKEPIPEQLQPIIQHLIELEQFVDQGVLMSFNQFKLAELMQQVLKAVAEVKPYSAQLAALNESIKIKKDAVDVSYTKFISKDFDRYDAREISIQKQCIADVIDSIKQNLKHLNHTQAEYEVALLEEQMNTLVNELKTLKVVTSSTYSDYRFDNLLSHLQTEQSSLERLKSEVTTLCKKSAHRLLLKDLQASIAKIEENSAAVAKEQDLLNKLFANHQLDNSEKVRLTQEFKNTADQESLIESYKNKVNGVASYLNIYAWGNYLSQPLEYNKNQATFKLELDFIDLLSKADLLAAEKAACDHSLALLKPLIINNQVTADDAQQFVQEASQLFTNDLLSAPNLSIPTGPDYYLSLNENISLIDQQINQKKEALGKLQKLVDLNKQLLVLCTDHAIILTGYEEKPSLADLKQAAEKDRVANAVDKKEFIEALEVYEQFAAQISEVETLIRDAERCELSIKSMQLKIQESQDIISDLEKQAAATTTQLQLSINKKLKLVKELVMPLGLVTPSAPVGESNARSTVSHPVPPADSAPAATVTKPAELRVNTLPIEPPPALPPQKPTVLTVNHPLSLRASRIDLELSSPLKSPFAATVALNKQPMAEWHREILNLLHNKVELKAWYLKVYSALAIDNIPSQDSVCRQAHVLRDILFELHKNDFTVLNAYMRLCVDPSKDINKLLQLKPDLPIADGPFDEQDYLNDCSQLRALYEQYKYLSKEHPVAAELLLQGIQSFKMALMFLDSKTPNNFSKESFPSLLQDPRFEPLKRHRGILRAWEFLEDFIRLCIGTFNNDPEHTYTKKPCFFNTRSGKLMEQADELIKVSLARATTITR